MLTDTEGIVLRQVKTSYNRKMILLFSKKYGKISAGTSLNERGKSKTTLALRPFTYGRYELFKNRNGYNINSAEALRSYYRIGEDVDKYMNGAYVLEFTEKILAEEMPAVGMFNLLIDFFSALENRERGIGTLVLAYQTKALKYAGVMPETGHCTICGQRKPPAKFSIKDGGVVCADCFQEHIKTEDREHGDQNTLIYDVEFGIVDILDYFTAHSIANLENLAIGRDAGRLLQDIIREYAAYYLDVSDMKSEKLI